VSRPAAAVHDADRLIVLTPIEPAPTGNGLAMRAELFRRAAPAVRAFYGRAAETARRRLGVGAR
jgi:hypothetical protein